MLYVRIQNDECPVNVNCEITEPPFNEKMPV